MRVVLVSPYEIGRQPFGLAEPAALLRAAGHTVECVDLSLERLAPETLAGADFIGLYVAMHTATRIAIEALPRIRAAAPEAHLCAYGLYAPMNEGLLREAGVGTVLGGEFEPGLLRAITRVAGGESRQREPLISHERVAFVLPAREDLPPLARYARLDAGDGVERVVGFAEATRGCRHLCSHCPVVPVYQGRFRALPLGLVLADVRQQVAAGAQHISFGDPDFFNGPTHARRLVHAMHAEFPDLTFDCTIKIEHLLRYAGLLPILREAGCLFVTSAVESLDDRVLRLVGKDHTAEDFERALALMREAGIALAPTFVAFTPWTSLGGYRDLLAALVRLRLVNAVPPVQLAIRLLLPLGSHLLRESELQPHLGDFDKHLLGHAWTHPDPRVDALQARVQSLVARAEQEELAREAVFAAIWAETQAALGESEPLPPFAAGPPPPHLTEQWYCCAEPTEQQLLAF